MNRIHSKKMKYLLFSSIALIVLGMTVAFAAMNQELIISGNVNKKGGTWEINLDNTQIEYPEVSGNAIVSKPVILDDNTISISASLMTGSRVSYDFSMVNDGTLDAKLDSYIISDSLLDNPNMEVELVYYDKATGITRTLVPGSDILKKDESVTFRLIIGCLSTANINEDISLEFTVSINYTQV